MSDGTADVSRRTFLRTATGTAAIAGAGAASAQENESGGNESSGGGGGGGGPPDFGGYLDDANEFGGSAEDATGQGEVAVDVGGGSDGLAFTPAAVKVDNGATVVWEWTGEGGAHNVVSNDGDFESGDPVAEAGTTFEYTFEEDGVYNYHCVPHEAVGMKGAIVVGSDYPTIGGGGSGGGGGGGATLPDSAKSLGVAASFVMAATLGLAYFFMKFGGDYEQPDA
ncbi:halocyanin domain-containing protein [Halobacteria archaeon HArc-gm2]|nr:halocyanin domain-containing protein [Halobacteria archaeon HArc-gm2]